MKKRVSEAILFVKSNNLAQYVITFFAVTFIFILCKNLGIKNDEAKTQFLMTMALSGLIIYAFWLQKRGKLTDEMIIRLIIFGGFVMYIGYMIYTHMFTRGNDLGPFASDGLGNLGYIYYIAEKGTLPNTNEWMLYHPPLYPIISAAMVRIMSLFAEGGIADAFEAAQIINCSLACIMLLVMRNFLKEININNKYAPWAMLIIAFFPCLYQIGGRLNNDMFAIFFSFLCIVNKIGRAHV